MTARSVTRLSLATAALLLGGCGTARTAAPSSGRTLFGQACGACHSLSGVDDPRRQGGDLLHFHSSRVQLLELTREMPVRRALSSAELQAVVSYVTDVERRRSGS